MVPICLDGVKKDLYYIEEDGRIWSNYKKGYMRPKTDKNGYLNIALSGGSRDKRKYYRIATLVGLTFLGNPPLEMKDPTINHIDGNILNNHYSNLEWIERSTNSSIRRNKGQGENNHEAKLTAADVQKICELLINSNLTIKEISDIYKVGKSTIHKIKKKETWKTITSLYNFDCRAVIRNERGQFQSVNTNASTLIIK